jgi:uncharacterized protein
MSRLATHPLIVAGLVTGLTAFLSHSLPPEHGASTIGLVFLGATYWLCLRKGQNAAAFGLSLGGLFEDARIDSGRLARETLGAFGIAALLSAAIFPFFYFGFQFWHAPALPFSLTRAWAGLNHGTTFGALDLALGHLLAVALPEEAFFRGYLQRSLLRRLTPSDPSERAPARGWQSEAQAIVISSAIFALGHFLTIPHPARLAVFFPSLAFGALRSTTRGIGASVFFHTLCNLYSAALFAGFGMG